MLLARDDERAELESAVLRVAEIQEKIRKESEDNRGILSPKRLLDSMERELEAMQRRALRSEERAEVCAARGSFFLHLASFDMMWCVPGRHLRPRMTP